MAEAGADLVESLRPRGALELIDNAASLLRRRWGDVSVLAAVALTPLIVFLIVDGSRHSADGSRLFDPSLLLEIGQSNESTLWTVSLLLTGSFSLTILTYSVTRLVLNDLVGREESPWQILRLTFGSFGRWFGAWLLSRIALGLGFLLCGVGALWPWVTLWVLIPVVAAEGLTPVAAVRRCAELTKGTRGRILGLAILLELTTLVVQLALAVLPAQMASRFVDGRTLSVVLALVGSAVAVVVEAISAATMVNAYLDLRVRREGLDLDLRMRALS